MELHGRRRERDVLDQLLRDVRGGRSRVLVVRGEPGVGKSVLLDLAAAQATAVEVVRAAGVEEESELANSALQQVCAPLMQHAARLSEVHTTALRTAFGLASGAPPEPLVLGMAVLALLAEAGAGTPLLCLVDDAQWLDRSSSLILGFVARRLDAESVGLVVAARTPAAHDAFTGLPELVVDGLDAEAAHALLTSSLAGPIDAAVRDRIVAETRGNPLALVELPRGVPVAELAFGFGESRDRRLTSRVEEGFRRRLDALGPDARTAVLAAAVEPVGDSSLLLRALDVLGVPPAAAAAAEAEGLLELGPRVRFRHPLVRSASWRSADPRTLRRVHGALAEVTDPRLEPDRRAWHRAHATIDPDESVAAELEASADRALARGGRAAAAAFLERSVVLSPDPARRAGRALSAALARLDSGEPAAVSGLLVTAERGPLDGLQRAQVARLRAQTAYLLNPGLGAGTALLEAAARLAPLEPTAARETYLAALGSALWSGRLGRPEALQESARAAATAPTADDAPGLFLQGLTRWGLDGPATGFPLLSRAVQTLTATDDLRLLWLAAMVSMELYDLESWIRVTGQAVLWSRTTGTLSILPAALSYRAGALVFAGRLDEARALQEESSATGQVTGVETFLATGAVMAAHLGREPEALDAIGRLRRDAHERGVGRLLGVAAYTRAVLYNGLGDPEQAMASAAEATRYTDLSMYHWSLGELVEAAVRLGEHEAAQEAAGRLSVRTSASGTPWALGAQALAQALTARDGTAETHYIAAVEHFGRGRVGMGVARANLLLGEWLRREGRRVDARERLRDAHEAFVAMGAVAFAERAGRELMATGETVRKRVAGSEEELTPQEEQVARLAMAGRTNPEIAATMFLSPRTVEWHLRKVFGKLGVTSRRDLSAALGAR
ncbi:LuxR family transcriptional regulator [Cellulosimicrobium sp. CUA-896]|nr:LuxR family transcriptional regulator [Cellulosimicrobium sp. CUA-896]